MYLYVGNEFLLCGIKLILVVQTTSLPFHYAVYSPNLTILVVYVILLTAYPGSFSVGIIRRVSLGRVLFFSVPMISIPVSSVICSSARSLKQVLFFVALGIHDLIFRKAESSPGCMTIFSHKSCRRGWQLSV